MGTSMLYTVYSFLHPISVAESSVLQCYCNVQVSSLVAVRLCVALHITYMHIIISVYVMQERCLSNHPLQEHCLKRVPTPAMESLTPLQWSNDSVQEDDPTDAM